MSTERNSGSVTDRTNHERSPSLEEHLEHAGVGMFQLCIFLIASLMVAADGMEMTVISLLRKPLQKEWQLNDYEFSSVGSTVFAGLLLGNLIGGYLADRYGRRTTMISISVLFCVFGILSALATNIWVFAISRFFTGVGVGSMVPVSDSHLLEWSPKEWRARLAMSLTGLAFAVGAAFACVVGITMHDSFDDHSWWRYMLAVCVLPGLVSLPLILLFLPESPHWLLVQGKDEEVQRLMVQLCEWNGVHPLAEGRVSLPEEAPPPSPTPSTKGHWGLMLSVDDFSIGEIFGRRLLSTSLFCTVAWIVCGFIYYGHIFIYPIILEDEYGMEIKEAYSTVLISIGVELFAVVVAMILMDMNGIGRRGTMIIGFFLCFVAVCLVPFCTNLSQFIALNSSIKGIIEGPFTLIYVFAGELFPTTHRGVAVAICNSFGRIAAMIAPVVLTACFHVSLLSVYIGLGLFALGGLLAAVYFNRETLGRPLVSYTRQIDPYEEAPPLFFTWESTDDENKHSA
ncbi:hypothetical protein GUITHDRAFT_102191 [Guillardia theta CCMP2712]|uniref:Major facilitator superfamily (MFS) profile domain-containing protein n=2 Tax=Guillardia theta TaxID=55529 RepID=L1JW32_GUITC|nr:hypothetical protein GUITHDRAFT_102191 [Guillardia theta CCMP2712]EKX52288.1 hypothetical protein GUITHDRAFT_102191 [Guillardia theta CCMP2712]|mmetsp:Transcript_32770/g.103684  ORF Transcript_32770/g.103684 Transcript_32770/m.103684 type:complete len:511 (+) Transcript_32770:103-1635(+)|eukprot:XP_005839268.1 hypothetical protein GUITHDRAFT_102191 [Guillardia theta CCMP2712]